MGVEMMIGRALLAIAVSGMALHDAAAQSDASPACQALLSVRDEWQKHGQAIETANKRKADVAAACVLFRRYIATEARLIMMLDADGPSCGVPAKVNQDVRASHAKAQQIGKQLCDRADQQPFLFDGRWPPLRRHE
jgi:hypothetical protein